MVADRQVLPVRQQRRLRPGGRSADVAWRGAQRSRSPRSRRLATAARGQSASGSSSGSTRSRRSRSVSSSISRAAPVPHRRAEREERVERRRRERPPASSSPAARPRPGRAPGRRSDGGAGASPPCATTPYGRWSTPNPEPSAPVPRPASRVTSGTGVQPAGRPLAPGYCTSRTDPHRALGWSSRPATAAITGRGSVRLNTSATSSIGASRPRPVGGQHVQESVVGEPGLRVGVPDRVVQPRGQLERQSPVPTGADTAASSPGVGNSSRGQSPGTELGRDPAPPRPALANVSSAASRPKSAASPRTHRPRRPVGQREQLAQPRLGVLAPLGHRHLDSGCHRGRRGRARRTARHAGVADHADLDAAPASRLRRADPPGRRRATAGGRPGRRTRRPGAAHARSPRPTARCRAGTPRRRRPTRPAGRGTMR